MAADWADRLGRRRPSRPASLHLRAEGIQDMLSSDVDCEVIWLHTLRMHIRFFHAHIVVIFLRTDTLKEQKASPGDKFFGLLGALNITYSIFIQMGHAICDVVIITYKRSYWFKTCTYVSSSGASFLNTLFKILLDWYCSWRGAHPRNVEFSIPPAQCRSVIMSAYLFSNDSRARQASSRPRQKGCFANPCT